jgi:hypothetical protein
MSLGGNFLPCGYPMKGILSPSSQYPQDLSQDCSMATPHNWRCNLLVVLSIESRCGEALLADRSHQDSAITRSLGIGLLVERQRKEETEQAVHRAQLELFFGAAPADKAELLDLQDHGLATLPKFTLLRLRT